MPLSPASKEPDTSTRTPLVGNASGAPIPLLLTRKNIAEEPGIARDVESVHREISLSAAGGGRDHAKTEVHKTTPLRPLLPAIGPKRTSHLPTPQSPNSVGTYASPLTYGVESPIHKGRHNREQSSPEERPHITPNERITPSTSLLITPESSPLFTRRSKTSHVPSSPPSTPPRVRSPIGPERSSFVTPHLPRSISVQHSGNSSPPSVLSSPFADISERRRSAKSTPRRSRASSPMLDAVFSLPSTSSAVTPPPLSAPIPHRAVPSEMQRIRLQMAADQAARLEEAEARRPDYFKRTKRPNSNPTVCDDASDDQENTHPALGVVDSPVKGRRLALFQETSEESFEQSLLAGGYPLYGHTPAYAEPASVRNGKLSHALDDAHEAERVPNEKDFAKQRRLAAFRDHNTNDTHTQLYPVTLEGIGRVLLDHIPPDSLPHGESPHRKKGTRKRKGPTLENPAKRILGSPGKGFAVLPQAGEVMKPNWPDKVFPWSLRTQQRAEYVKKDEEERLRWIERYLDRDSDEDDDNEDQSLGLPPIEEEVAPRRRGRGKMVPLRSNPDNSNHFVKRERTMLPSDPADARAALLSKRSVRALAFRRRQEEKDTVCICHGTDDGRDLVQCDECHKWFHLECIGINDITELGKEEDPWYCDQCLGVDKPVLSSPTFVPTDDRLPASGRRDLVFFPGNVQESPHVMSWSTPTRVPTTPTHGKDLTRTSSTRSSMGDSSQFGPETPSNTGHSVRVYSTPGPTSFLETVDEPFDPTSTPSRGMKFSGPFTTPKAPSTWYRAGPSQTPTLSGRKFSGGSFPFTFESGNASGPSRNVYVNEESPVRRSTKPSVYLRPPESPLGPRSSIFPVYGSQGSRRSSIEKLHNS